MLALGLPGIALSALDGRPLRAPTDFSAFWFLVAGFASTILASSNVFGAAAFGVSTPCLFNCDSYNLERTRLFNEWKTTVDIDLDMGGNLMINLF